MGNAAVEEVRSTLECLIDEFREEYDKSSDDILEHLSNMEDFRPPCQLELFWLSDPFDFQFLVKTRDDNRPDREIIINGPYLGSEFVEEVDDVLEEPRWQQLVKDSYFRHTRGDQPTKRRDQITPIISRFAGSAKDAVFQDREPQFGYGSALSRVDWCFIFRGNIRDADIKQYVEEELSEAQEAVEEVENESASDESEESDSREFEEVEDESRGKTLEGFSAYIYHPVWVNGPPEKSFRDQVFGTIKISHDLVINTEFLGRLMQVNRDGLIFIEADSSDEAVQILNTLFCVGLFFDHSWHAVQPDELHEMTTDPEGGSRTASGRVTLPRGILRDPQSEMILPGSREIISEEEFMKIIEQTEDTYQDTNLREKFIFALQAFTHHLNSEYTQGFLLNWILIEQHITDLLDDYLENKLDISNNRRETITDSPHWFASHVIELSELVGAIDKDTYREITEMRKLRNRIVHGMEQATEGDSERILVLALGLISEDSPLTI